MSMPAKRPDPLLLRFASRRPDEMAGLLAGVESNQLADFIAELPVARAAAVASRLPSWQLTALLRTLDAAVIAGMLDAAAPDDAVAIVSHLSESRYEEILTAASDEHRAALRQLFEYPSHSLASLATTAFIRVTEDTLCSAFCEQLSDSVDTRTRPVLVVDQHGRYQGMLSLRAAYARKNRARTVGEVAVAVEALSGLTSAESALKSRQWMRFTELPVVDGRHRVLGAVSRATLLRVVGEGTPADFSLERLFAELATGYLNTCGRLLESLLGKRS